MGYDAVQGVTVIDIVLHYSKIVLRYTIAEISALKLF
jgi:hypothetical protein